MRLLHTKQIRNLEGVAIGLAEFENKLQEFADLGGQTPGDADKKSDLLAILPQEMKELMIWRATDPDESYQNFRDRVQTQTAQILLNRKKLPVHAVQADEDDDVDDFYIDPANMTKDELVAVVNRLNTQGRVRQGPGRRFGAQRRTGAPGAAPPPKDRPPRKCANCGEAHPGACPKARVATADRLCCGCGKPGHTSANCPAKAAQRPGAVKAVENSPGKVPIFGLGNDAHIMHIDHEGFQRVQRRGRPQPRAPVLGDFLSSNNFAALHAVYDESEDSANHVLGSSGGEAQNARNAGFAAPPSAASKTSAETSSSHPGPWSGPRPNRDHQGEPTAVKAMFPSLREALGEVEQALHEEELCAASAAPSHTTLLAEMQAVVQEKLNAGDALDLLEDQEEPDGQINAVQPEVRARVAMDSGLSGARRVR